MTSTPPKRQRLHPGVAAGHPLTATAGIEILEDGGNAADAAAAMVLMSCVAETIFTGLGGGGFATYYDAATGEVTCLDFFVAVPGLGAKQPGPMVPIEVEFGGQPLAYLIGSASAAVPGTPRGVEYLHRRFGSLPWADIVNPAIVRADHGVILTEQHKIVLDDIWSCMGAGLGNEIHRRADGDVIDVGDVLHVPGLAAALIELRDAGADSFYTGKVSDAMLRALGDDGALDPADLAAYDVIETPARSVDVRGRTIHARGDDLDDLLGTLVELERPGLQEAFRDPASATALIDALRAPTLRTETTNLVAADPMGNVCVVTTSLGLGTGVWVPEYGLHPNSMLGEVELVRPNAAPGSRMGSMMSPLIAIDDDGPIVAAGAAGGSRIRGALIQVLLGVLLGERTTQSAINSPRLNPVDGVVRMEAGFSPDVIRALEEEGETVVILDTLHAYFGGVSAISRQDAGADPRRGGAAISLT